MERFGRKLLARVLGIYPGPTYTVESFRRSDFHETDAGWETPYFEQGLRRVASLFERGFGEATISLVMRRTASLELDEERSYLYTVAFKGRKAPLEIAIFRDDVDSYDLYFVSTKEIVDEIERTTREFATELGM